MKILNKVVFDTSEKYIDTIYVDDYTFLFKNPIYNPNETLEPKYITIYDIDDLNKFEKILVEQLNYLIISIETKDIKIYSI